MLHLSHERKSTVDGHLKSKTHLEHHESESANVAKEQKTASYSNATHNFKVKKSAWKSAQNLRRLYENGAQNFQFLGAEFRHP